MPAQTIILKPTRFRRRALAVNHALPGVLLVLDGIGTLAEGRGEHLPLAAAGIIAGAAVLATVGRELAARVEAEHRTVGWIDVFAGIVLVVEGANHFHPDKGFQPAHLYALVGVATSLKGLFHARLARWRRITFDEAGITGRLSLFRSVRLRWSDVASVVESGDRVLAVIGPDESRRTINLRGVENVALVKEAFREQMEQRKGRQEVEKQDSLPERIAALESGVMEKQRELSALRKQVPRDAARDHILKGPGGADVRLSDLFGDRRDLIVVHNMGSGCPYCTLWADGFNGMLPHLEDRAAFVVVSPDSPETQRSFAGKRGWRFRMVSSGDSPFTEEMGFVHHQGGKRSYQPGFSTFHKGDDGAIIRVASASFGPGDPYCGIWHMFDLLKDVAGGWEPKFSY